jgi:hypothetical protein
MATINRRISYGRLFWKNAAPRFTRADFRIPLLILAAVVFICCRPAPARVVETTPAKTAEDPLAVVVCVPKVNLRAGPATDARIVAVCGEGTYLRRLSEEGRLNEQDGLFWVQVRGDGNEGWMANDFIMPAAVYEAVRLAHDRGRAGDAAGMIAELKKISEARNGEDKHISVSPDGKKAFCSLAADVNERYTFVDLYFVAGAGFVKKIGESVLENAITWSPDNKYWARENGRGLTAIHPVYIHAADTGGILCECRANDDNSSFVGGYFIYLGEQSGWGEPGTPPALYYLRLPNGKPERALDSDLKDTRVQGDNGTVEYRLKATGEPPNVVTSSPLYRKFADAYAPGSPSTE